MVLPIQISRQQRLSLYEFAFDSAKFAHVAVIPCAIAGLVAYGRTTGTYIGMGHNDTTVVSIYNLMIRSKALQKLGMGWKDVLVAEQNEEDSKMIAKHAACVHLDAQIVLPSSGQKFQYTRPVLHKLGALYLDSNSGIAGRQSMQEAFGKVFRCRPYVRGYEIVRYVLYQN